MYGKNSWPSAVLSAALALLLGFLASPALADTTYNASPDAVQAEARRVPGKSAAVYYLKGYSKDENPGVNCQTYWGPLPKAMRDWGWNGPVHHARYYKGDSKCGTKLAAKDQSVSIRTLGRELARHIYDNYTSKGRPVKLIGHSMGGLVARAALSGVQRQESGFPKSLWVEDVVTFDTGHKGHNWTGLCGSRQCQDQRSGSAFLKTWALDNPQGVGGTDWTLLSVDEFPSPDRVTTQSALGMNSNHFVHYKYFQANHGNLPEKVSGDFKFWYQRQGYPIRHVGQGASPGRMADLALSTARW
ncbi:esterase/lipase family protein [Streptomyces niveus]|uniref:esterase/lipase family protein n=1 Tax=Streptomyces niveus TaxID=193462 RepID=UPI0035E35A48